MLNYKKPLIFTITKINRNEEEKENDHLMNQLSSENKNRSPWTKEEDEAVVHLVTQVGTKNWTTLAKKMAEFYSFHHRTGKQCRERWHNHLDPNIKKDYWTDEEERTLMLKHMEYGNKWSEIARYLPGRTDNTIKNHFYSKLRKFIRKIMKILHKENVFQENSIDSSYYTADKIYKLIKKQKIPYDSLSKDSIVDLILKHDIHNNGIKKKASNSKGFKKTLKPLSNAGIVYLKNKQEGFNKGFLKFDCSKNDENCEENPNINTILDIENQSPQISLNFLPGNYTPNLQNSSLNINSNDIMQSQFMMNNINSLNKLITTINMPNNTSNNVKNENEQNFTVKLIQNLNDLSNNNKNAYNNTNNINSNSNINNGNLSSKNFLSQNNTDNLNINCFNYPSHMNRNLPQYHYESLNDVYTMNMSRIIPQMNNTMGNFTLGNNTFQNQEKKVQNTIILKDGESDSNNNQISELLLNNLINNQTLISKPNANPGTTMNYNNNNDDGDVNGNFNRNLSFSFDNDSLFNPDLNLMNGNNANSRMNTSRSFQKMKSFNCVEPEVLQEDMANNTNIFLNNSNLNNALAPCFPFANINTNTPNGYEISNFEKFKNFCELQQSIFNKQQGQVQNQMHGLFGNNMGEGNLNASSFSVGNQNLMNRSPAISPKSSLFKNFSHNLPNYMQSSPHNNANTPPSNKN